MVTTSQGKCFDEERSAPHPSRATRTIAGLGLGAAQTHDRAHHSLLRRLRAARICSSVSGFTLNGSTRVPFLRASAAAPRFSAADGARRCRPGSAMSALAPAHLRTSRASCPAPATRTPGTQSRTSTCASSLLLPGGS